MSKKTYIKYIPGRSLTYESRDKRELSAAREAGFAVKVIGADDRAEFESCYPDYELISDGIVELNSSIPKPKKYFLILRNYFSAIKAVYITQGDAISCHDIDSLFMCWIGQLFKMHKAKMIYDSHEFEIGRNKKRNKLQLWWVTHLERFLIKRCAFSIMVNDSIADEVQRIHGLAERPIVVRSTPEEWKISPEVCSEKRRELLARFGDQVDFLLMFHGNLGRGNGIGRVIKALAEFDGIGLVLMGSHPEEAFISELEALAKELGVSDRVLYLPPVEGCDIWKYAGAVDVEMMIIEPIVKSYYYCLPNKFFESVQSLTPIIASDLPEMKRLIDAYQIGLTCKYDDADALADRISRMRNDRELVLKFRDNLKKAKHDLCWENEKEILKKAYRTFL